MDAGIGTRVRRTRESRITWRRRRKGGTGREIESGLGEDGIEGEGIERDYFAAY